MNTTLFKILPVIIGCAFMFSCTKDYEKEPLELVTEDYLWNDKDPNGTYAENFLAGIYTSIPERAEINGLPMEANTDDAVPSDPLDAVFTLNRNGFSATGGYDDVWGTLYAGIRKANIFLTNQQKVPWADANKKLWYPNEARFLRAWFYYELVKRYGGVILLSDKVLTLSDDIQLPRSSFDECVNYILSECDSIKNNLRPETALSSRSSDGNAGRVTQGTAYALKAKLLLLAASPLYNPSGDISKWKLAADAARELINRGSYQLETSLLTPFIQRANKESIFFRQTGGGNTDIETKNSPVGYTSNGTPSQGRISPTQELVDAFPDKNGMAIDVAGTLYDAANPYANRDPRLNYTVFYNGMKWLNRNVETFDGGKDKLNSGTAVQTQTGYYQRKFCGDFASTTAYSNHDHCWIYIRYPDIMLAFAEAQNEVDGTPSAEVYQVLKDIRKRAGIAAGAGNMYGLKSGMTKEEMRAAIRNERRIEMAFEGQRFFDLRRWKTAEQVYNKSLTAMQITKTTSGAFTYQRTQTVPGPYFDASSMYLYPISNSEVLKNSNLTQNPGF